MDLIIRNGQLFTGSNSFKADIGIKKGKIAAISESLLASAKEEIDATNKYIFPGFIDAHTHLELPITETISSVDDFLTGTRAAAFGGTTSIVDYIVPYPHQTLTEAFHMWTNKAKDKAVIDYGFHMTISNPTSTVLDEIKELNDLGITSIKCFTAYLNKFMMTDDQVFKVLKESLDTKILVCMHCENGYMLDYLIKQFVNEGKLTPEYHPLSRPPLLEEESIGRSIDLAKLAGAPIYIAHLSTDGGLNRIVAARNNAQKVIAETCPQYLVLSDEVYNLDGFESAKYVCSPPIRPKTNVTRLWEGLISKNIEVLATDHCPFNFNNEKQAGKDNFTKIPNGIPAIEDRVPLIFSESVVKRKMDINQFVTIASVNPAKFFGLYPQKGNLGISADADIVIYNPDTEWVISAQNHHQNVDYSIFEGHKVTGKSEVVISKGSIIVKDDQFLGQPGSGNYLHRSASSLFD